MNTTNLFERWFISRFGSRPIFYGKSDFDLVKMIKLGKDAELIRNSQIVWDEKFEVAINTWNLKNKLPEQIEQSIK